MVTWASAHAYHRARRQAPRERTLPSGRVLPLGGDLPHGGGLSQAWSFLQEGGLSPRGGSSPLVPAAGHGGRHGLRPMSTTPRWLLRACRARKSPSAPSAVSRLPPVPESPRFQRAPWAVIWFLVGINFHFHQSASRSFQTVHRFLLIPNRKLVMGRPADHIENSRLVCL